MKKTLEFYASMYLESICDETRSSFLHNWNCDSKNGADKVEAFREQIETKEYNALIKTFQELMKAKKGVMFQTKTQESLTEETKYWSITVLASSDSDAEKIDQIGVLRSELLDFFRNHEPNNGRPFSCELLNVNDSVRVVLVESNQKDLNVVNYVRESCTIAYVRLDYSDHLHSNGVGSLYFAFIYSKEQSDDLMEVLKHLQGFLSFRHNLKQRIEKDFNGNLFGKSAKETWRIDWLSIEKAGAHTDSSGVHRLINQRSPRSSEDILDALFVSVDTRPEDSSQLLKLYYNILIAMYFRAVISDRDDQFRSADNIEDGEEGKYSKVSDLIKFSEKDYGKLKLRFRNNQNAEHVNNSLVYGAYNTIHNPDGKSTAGVPAPKQLSFRKQYLQAFLVDILCNIVIHGTKDKDAEIYIEDRYDSPGYLVFRNQVVSNSDDNEGWCEEKNYRLKQSIEFDHVGNSLAKGFSLGCIAHHMRWAGELIAYYSCMDGETYFTIKLPIIQSKKEEGTENGQIIDC